ncbi:hypothetical protein Tco_1410671 [Tanacetum coccineum]
MMPEDPYAYVGAAIQEQRLRDFVPRPVYPKFMPHEDDVLPVEEDDADDEDEEEEEHLALADSVPPPAYRTTCHGWTPPLLPILLPTSSPPFLLPSTDCRTYVLEVTLPPQKRLCIAPGPRYEVGKCSSAPTARPNGGFRADYGFVSTQDAEIRHDPDREIGRIQMKFMGDLTMHRMIDLMSGQLNLLRRDRRSHARMARLMESEARASREAWHTEIGDLRAIDRRRQAQLAKALSLDLSTEGVVGLTQWFERMENVFNISNCAVENQVKFATCNLHDVALTWMKSQVKTVG